jgi:hypothetical protein
MAAKPSGPDDAENKALQNGTRVAWFAEVVGRMNWREVAKVWLDEIERARAQLARLPKALRNETEAQEGEREEMIQPAKDWTSVRSSPLRSRPGIRYRDLDNPAYDRAPAAIIAGFAATRQRSAVWPRGARWPRCPVWPPSAQKKALSARNGVPACCRLRHFLPSMIWTGNPPTRALVLRWARSGLGELGFQPGRATVELDEVVMPADMMLLRSRRFPSLPYLA